MKKQHEATASDLVIEHYAIENANLKLQNAHLQMELTKHKEKESKEEKNKE